MEFLENSKTLSLRISFASEIEGELLFAGTNIAQIFLCGDP